MTEHAPTYGNGVRSLADEAYDRIEELIVTLSLPPGHTFSEGELIETTRNRANAHPGSAPAHGVVSDGRSAAKARPADHGD